MDPAKVMEAAYQIALKEPVRDDLTPEEYAEAEQIARALHCDGCDA